MINIPLEIWYVAGIAAMFLVYGLLAHFHVMLHGRISELKQGDDTQLNYYNNAFVVVALIVPSVVLITLVIKLITLDMGGLG